jgi:hypothetical protein
MSSAASASLRRLVLLAILIAAGGAVFARLRSRNGGDDGGPPEWPPFEPRIVPTIESDDRSGQGRAPVPGTGARHSAETWMRPAADGATPDGFPVKVKVSSGIFHVPGGRFYERTTADRCYPSAAAAEADGYRPSKS